MIIVIMIDVDIFPTVYAVTAHTVVSGSVLAAICDARFNWHYKPPVWGAVVVMPGTH